MPTRTQLDDKVNLLELQLTDLERRKSQLEQQHASAKEQLTRAWNEYAALRDEIRAGEAMPSGPIPQVAPRGVSGEQFGLYRDFYARSGGTLTAIRAVAEEASCNAAATAAVRASHQFDSRSTEYASAMHQCNVDSTTASHWESVAILLRQHPELERFGGTYRARLIETNNRAADRVYKERDTRDALQQELTALDGKIRDCRAKLTIAVRDARRGPLLTTVRGWMN